MIKPVDISIENLILIIFHLLCKIRQKFSYNLDNFIEGFELF